VRWLLAAFLVAAVACGQTSAQSRSSPIAQLGSPSATSAAVSQSRTEGSSPSPSPIPTGRPSPTLLFAALEAKGTTNPQAWNTVAIAGLDGYARAKATFTPMPLPYVGCAGAVLPTMAYAVAGKVYFSDNTGRIRSLSITDQVALVTTFPIASTQQMLSFAVSPDGSRLLAAIFTLPPKPASGDPCGGAPAFGPGSFTLDVYSAAAGGSSQLLYHEVLATSAAELASVMAFIGWDQVGPVGTYPTEWATQGGGPIHYFGLPVRIDTTTGKVTGPVSSTCQVWDIAANGDYVCEGGGAMSVRGPDGSELWHVVEPANESYFLDLVSPDIRHVVAATSSGTKVFATDGSAVTLAGPFQHEGWLDATTLIGGNPGTNFSYVSLAAPGTQVDIGFKGLFVGTVRN
jgi:hypothetical protein